MQRNDIEILAFSQIESDAKVCRICGELRSLDDYYKDSNMSDGHRNECKVCQNAKRKQRRINKSAFDSQVGGSHYKNFTIQPAEFILKNNIRGGVSDIIEYIIRYREKGGLQDLKKVVQWARMIAEVEYGEYLD